MKSPLLKVERTGEEVPGIGTEKSKASKLRAFGKITGFERSLHYQEERDPGVSAYHAYHESHEELENAVETERCKAVGMLAYQRRNLPR